MSLVMYKMLLNVSPEGAVTDVSGDERVSEKKALESRVLLLSQSDFITVFNVSLSSDDGVF